MKKTFPLPLACPFNGESLLQDDDHLVSKSGDEFFIEDQIPRLIHPALLDSALKNEMEVFENIPIAKVPYFRSILFEEAITLVAQSLENRVQQATLIEIGGGEGYFAQAFKSRHPDSIACVCDVSMKHLKQASPSLVKIQCDARKPYLMPETVDVAAFWVSLHHFSEADGELALDQAKSILKPGGILLLFEPNWDFFPRRILLSSPLKKLVYYDEQEQALTYSEIKSYLIAEGFTEIFAQTHNPPYNRSFLKLLRWSWLFTPITETFFQLERMFQGKNRNWWNVKDKKMKKEFCWGSYFLALLRKHQ